MLYVDGTNIRLTRGDTAYLEVPIYLKKDDGSSEPYEMKDSDILTFTVKKSIKQEEALFVVKLTGENLFHILPEHTKELGFARYIYDIQITTEDGDVYTIIEPSVFEVMGEVSD